MPPPRRRAVRRLGTTLLSLTVLAGAALTAAAPALAAPDDPAAAGSALLDSGGTAGREWQVTRAAGGYEVSLSLPEPLPVKSDAPTIVVDGQTIGIATEDADGLGLSVFTTDPTVTSTSTVRAGWASQTEAPAGRSAATGTAVEVPEERAVDPIDVDPAAPGDYEWTESIYRFGDQAVPLSAIGGVRGELEGKIYLPTTGGARPTVMLLHGRHTSCYGPGTANPNRWPCAVSPDLEDRRSIPSYAGYDALARILAGNGYAVVSVSANAINSNDNQLAADQGAVARGRLMLDTVEMLDDASAGRPVSYYDAWRDRTLDLDQALVEGTRSYGTRSDGFVNGAPPLDIVTAADLVGRFDLSTIGMMGHSRGGEGVTAAVTLNAALEDPWAIESVLPLAPVDFGRMTVPDVPMNVVLPYCDGDVSNQQGQHMLDDSRYAFGDDVLRSGTWVMGANHNFYNTVWTPGEYAFSVSDDWSGTNPASARATEPTCGTAPSTAGTSIRLSPAEQYQQGASYMAAWFLMTLGGQDEFTPMFDGTGGVPAALGDVDVRTVATAPASERATIASFERSSSLVRVANATLVTCASLAGRTTPQDLTPCASTLASSQVPHWTPASNAGNVPATPTGRLSWSLTSATTSAEVRVGLPAARRDATSYDRLAIKLAADETVPTAVDMTVTVTDGAGTAYAAPVSEFNPLALTRLPSSESSAAVTTLKKVVLQQVNVPVADLVAAGLDVSDLREVRLTSLPNADGSNAGGVHLSDLALERSGVGTPDPGTRPTMSVFAPKTDEGSAPGTVDVAVYLDEPAAEAVSGYVSLLGSATSRAGATMEPVTFAPGETCRVVSAAVQGDRVAGASNGSAVKASVVDTSGAVMGERAIVTTVLREDDGVTGTAVELPPVGTPGAVCEELDAFLAGGEVTAPADVAPEGSLPVSAGGFRPGEAVVFSAPGLTSVTAVADGDGLAAAELAVPADAALGELAVTATGFATERVATGTTAVLGTSAVALTLDPEAPALREAVTLTATVTAGDEANGTVEFADGETVVGTADVVDGVASLEVPGGFGAGDHTLSATYSGDDLTSGSTSAPVALTLAPGASTVALEISDSPVHGTPATVTATVDTGDVPGADAGEVEITYGSQTRTVAVGDDGTAVLALPAGLAAGSYTVGATYLGTEDIAPSETAEAPLVVARRPSTTGFRSLGFANGGRQVRAAVQLGGTGYARPTDGRVTLRIRGAVSRTVTQDVGAGGRVTFTVAVPASARRLQVTATSSGLGDYLPATSRERTLRR
ncbi:hypothetical protein GCM10009737_16690 [Nocardioides lentus]|uniref:Bacterial Ig-like domain-containing protein n=1 Tax=Nocardioides lentus TaxID=338077 RepID=A0ABN2P9V7_9ACTN